MKKIIIICTVLLLLGCDSDTLEGYITKECIKEDNYNGVINTNKVIVKNKDNNVTNITYSYKYETNSKVILDSYKQSLIAQSNEYKVMPISMSSNDLTNSFEMIYDIDISSMDENVKSIFDIDTYANIQISKLEKEGYSCK